MKPTKVVIISGLALSFAIVPFLDFTPQSKDQRYPIGMLENQSRDIASVSEFSHLEKAGMIIVPRITAIRKVSKMAKENREQLEKFENSKEQYNQLIIELEEAKEGLEQDLADADLSKEEIEKQIKLVEEEFDKAKEELDLYSEKIEKQNKLISDLEYRSCLQDEKISSLENDLKDQIEAKEKAIKKLAKNDVKKKKDEVNIEDIVEAFRSMLTAQMNFNNQFQNFNQPPQSPYNFGMNHSPFMMQGMMQNQNAMVGSMAFPNGGYFLNSQAQHDGAFGVPFLNKPFMSDLDINDYYGITNQKDQQPQFPQNGIANHRYQLFPDLGRTPANNGPTFFGQETPTLQGQKTIEPMDFIQLQ